MLDCNKYFGRVLFLSDREYEVFKLIGQGLSPREIAQIKGKRVTISTVSTLLGRALDKLRLKNRRHLVCLAACYNFAGLKRAAVLPASPHYKFRSLTEPIVLRNVTSKVVELQEIAS